MTPVSPPILLWLLLLPARSLVRMRSARLFELREIAPNVFLMTWKVPALGDYRLGIAPRFPGCCHSSASWLWTRPAALRRARKVGCDSSLAGQTIASTGSTQP